MVLPAGTTIPPLPYLLALIGSLVVVGALLVRRDPPVTDVTVLALGPWMVAGAAAYVTYQLDIVPDPLAPFASSPAVYGTAAVIAGAVWLLADEYTAVPVRILGFVGALAALPPTAAALFAAPRLTPVIPLISLGASAVLTLAYMVIADAYLRPLATTGYAGVLVVFGQTLDGLTTTLGVAHLGFGEQTPLSRLLIEATAGIPAPFLGAGWLFLLVKLALGVGVVWLLAPTVERQPRQGHLLLAVVAAVGLGPGAHNLLLFTVTTP